VKYFFLVLFTFFGLEYIVAQNNFSFRGHKWGTAYHVIKEIQNVYQMPRYERDITINSEEEDIIYQYCLAENTEVAGYKARAVYIFNNAEYNPILFKAYYRLGEGFGLLFRNDLKTYDDINNVFNDLKNKISSIYVNPKVDYIFSRNIYNSIINKRERFNCSVLWEIDETIIELCLYYYPGSSSCDIYIVYKDKNFYNKYLQNKNNEIRRRQESREGL
jgi:hypothetical protein